MTLCLGRCSVGASPKLLLTSTSRITDTTATPSTPSTPSPPSPHQWQRTLPHDCCIPLQRCWFELRSANMRVMSAIYDHRTALCFICALLCSICALFVLYLCALFVCFICVLYLCFICAAQFEPTVGGCLNLLCCFFSHYMLLSCWCTCRSQSQCLAENSRFHVHICSPRGCS